MSYNEFHSRSRLRYAMHWLGTRVIPRYADGSITINFRLNDLLQGLGKPVIAIPGLVDVNEVEELGPVKEEGDACDKSSFLVGYIGSGKLGDGLEELVAAFATLRGKNQDVRLRCIGSHAVQTSLALDDCDPSVRSHIDSLGWLTRREYLEAISHCDCVVLPRPQSHVSTYNFPSRLPEALALGVPVITGNSGSVGDFVKEGGGCLLETDGRADNIAIAILRLRNDQTSRSQMRERCQAMARDYFDYRNYSELLSGWLWRLEYAAVT
jgi:glycosyltransferase involved in cell wall biosynthesis